MATSLNGRPFLGTFALVLLAIAGLWVADTFLARIEQADSQTQAERLFDEAQALLKKGENTQAIDRIQDAIAIERENRGYLQLLAEAQFAAGEYNDAQSILGELLESDATDGGASLLMARIAAKQGRFGDAVSYFHRAIYGHWKDAPAANSQRARRELIDFLARHNSKEQLLAELLPVEEYAPKDLKDQLRLGQLFLMAGSPNRADDVFRAILRNQPASAEAHKGMGEADFAKANYRAAQREFQTALRLAPNDQGARQRLDECDQLLQLDPTLRGIDSAERYRRSVRLVELTSEKLGECLTQKQPAELQPLLDKAAAALNTNASISRRSEDAEANLDLAEQLWQACKKECNEPVVDSPLTLVMARMAQ
jgi:tetratricopeptide (TPR) repeat protein